jgi:branched-chain amino acid transport system substrate-binding protein
MKRIAAAVGLVGLSLPLLVLTPATAAVKPGQGCSKLGETKDGLVCTAKGKKKSFQAPAAVATTAAPATTAAASVAATTVAAAPAKVACPNGDTVRFLVAFEANQPAGLNFKRGVELATSDINAKGGILGCKVELDTQDTQNVPDKSKQIIAKGLESKPYVVMGTVFSGSTIVNMIEAQRAKTPQFTGGEAASLTDRKVNGSNDYIFRTSFGQAISFPKLANYVGDDLKVKNIGVVYINNDFGIGGRDAARRVFKDKNVNIVKEIAGQPGQTDFSAEVAAANGLSVDALFVYMNETETGNFLKEFKRQGGTLPLIGETTLTAASTLALAGNAANGAVAHVGLSAAAPQFNAWVTRYLGFHKISAVAEYPDHNALKGYMGMHVVKEMTERIGSFDNVRLAKDLHCTKITTKDEPGVLIDVEYDANGDIDRQSFLTQVVNGEERVVKTLPALGGKRPGC